MSKQDGRLTKRARESAACLFMCLAGSVAAAPAVQGVSGTLDHKGTVTITGSGFGTKAVAAPVVWDDVSGPSLLSKWSGAWPNLATNSTYNTQYRAPIRGIGLPHNHITKYIAGGGVGGAADSGNNVIFWKNRTITSYPAYTYASWYYRADDNWLFNAGNPVDNNLKHWDYSASTEPYNNDNWYLAFGPPLPKSNSPTDFADWLLTDDGPSLQNPDQNGHIVWWGHSINPMAGKWIKIELQIKYTNQNDGYVKMWENGVLKMNYLGPTDKYSGTARAEGVGGFQRSYSPNNFRYWADVYLDYTPARVVLANASSLNLATIVETQIPTAWTAGSISITVNLGQFATGQTAYLFVVDSTGTPSAAGLPVTVGGTAPGQLTPPTNLRVQ